MPMVKSWQVLLGWNFGDGHLHNERLLVSYKINVILKRETCAASS